MRELFALASGAAVAVARNYQVAGLGPDDLKQEALIAAWASLSSYRPERGPLLPYVRRCVRNLMLTLSSRSQRSVPIADESEAELVADPLDLEGTVVERLTAVAIATRCRELAVTPRDQIILRAILGDWGTEELARALGLSRSAAAAARHRFTDRMRLALAEEI